MWYRSALEGVLTGEHLGVEKVACDWDLISFSGVETALTSGSAVKGIR